VSARRASGGEVKPGEVLLTVKDVDVFYGAIHALKGVSLEIQSGEIVSLIGGNGAGKSCRV
jgi:branched-chain amino acid transport system ATP-binding protein